MRQVGRRRIGFLQELQQQFARPVRLPHRVVGQDEFADFPGCNRRRARRTAASPKPGAAGRRSSRRRPARNRHCRARSRSC
jgi:hypothetical protein